MTIECLCERILSAPLETAKLCNNTPLPPGPSAETKEAVMATKKPAPKAAKAPAKKAKKK